MTYTEQIKKYLNVMLKGNEPFLAYNILSYMGYCRIRKTIPNTKYKNVVEEIKWLRNMYMTKIKRPNDPLVKNITRPLPKKLHEHFVLQISVEYLENDEPDEKSIDARVEDIEDFWDDESDCPLDFPNISQEELNEWMKTKVTI